MHLATSSFIAVALLAVASSAYAQSTDVTLRFTRGDAVKYETSTDNVRTLVSCTEASNGVDTDSCEYQCFDSITVTIASTVDLPLLPADEVPTTAPTFASVSILPDEHINNCDCTDFTASGTPTITIGEGSRFGSSFTSVIGAMVAGGEYTNNAELRGYYNYTNVVGTGDSAVTTTLDALFVYFSNEVTGDNAAANDACSYLYTQSSGSDIILQPTTTTTTTAAPSSATQTTASVFAAVVVAFAALLH
jgi:hypothetical protein